MYSLATPIENLTRVGKTTAGRLKRLGLNTVNDLLYYFPFRYEDFSQIVQIKDLRPNQTVTVKGKIVLIDNRRARRKRMTITEALIEDDTGSIKVIWFNQPFLIKNLHSGDEIFIAGTVEFDNLSLQFVSPAYEKITGQEIINTAKIVPVYSLTSNLTQKQLRFLINLSLQSVKQIIDWLPLDLRDKNNLLPLPAALHQIHFPNDTEMMEQARYRLKFDELFLIALQNQLLRQFLAQAKAPQITFKEKEIKEFVAALPFTLTSDQKKVSWQILLDLEKSLPANRLIEGDVGSGKTIVAAIALYNTALNSFQAVVMAPTEILARQHFATLCELLLPKGIKIALLTSSEKKLIVGKKEITDAKEVLDQIKKGAVDLIIGTHALIQDEVSYGNLGLVIIDEQHRFGVEQRKMLKEKNNNSLSPHFISMTATPIPRSLALILYGELDLSLIKEMPKGRKKIITKIVQENNRFKAYEFIRQEIKNGRQVFVICPLIDPSDKLGVKSVKEEFKRLDKDIFPDLAIGLLHGKLKAKEKENIMADFKNNKIKILVSTSVIEVGIDIPNATIMMIEGAERFGLAQLHQFRGRVGRGEDQSYCFLFAENGSPKTRERLESLVKSNDGFALAEYDLRFRGPGEVFGTRQSGLPEFKIADLTDLDLINLTKTQAREFLELNDIADFPQILAQIKQNKIIDHLE
ncbi:MAG: ATP-dependent DNA helicase RecG [Candidatus Buchananbacteria bacterium RBG_13_39_9]|uniref:ATP-dependent DNA helicase RecG n=1 Tax=Candidatus Buchananbacteria bacterium RBG_13_39_9 TaxID=1797531 RepID=A0A1G1XS34_9BACT|nr:MAG: ATP-dependent DNA helicase RecG [Candidatus Buchananbacteria bacterium RBG_13_39_9]